MRSKHVLLGEWLQMKWQASEGLAGLRGAILPREMTKGECHLGAPDGAPAPETSKDRGELSSVASGASRGLRMPAWFSELAAWPGGNQGSTNPTAQV